MNSNNKLFNIALIFTVGGLILISPPMLHFENDDFDKSAKNFYNNIFNFRDMNINNTIKNISSDSLSFGYVSEKHNYNNSIMYNNINGFPVGKNPEGRIKNVNDCVYIWNNFSNNNNLKLITHNSFENINYKENTIYVEFYKQTCEFKYNKNNIEPLKTIVYDAENMKIEFKNFFNKGDINV